MSLEPSIGAVRASISPPKFAELWRHPALLVWCAFVLLIPLYVMQSGLPQPSDALVVLLLPLTLASWDGRMEAQAARTMRALLWFTLWVFIVNYGWALVLWKWSRFKDYLVHPFYWVFNVSVFFAGHVVARRNPKQFLRVTVEIVYAAVFLQFVASFVYRTELYRGELFFNSPNQLGYYVLLSACLFAMTQRALGISRLRAGIGVTCCVYLAVLSASRASAVGISVLLFILLFSNPRTILIASLAAVGLLTMGGPISKAIDNAKERTESAQARKTSFADERGYDRIWTHPEYLLLGAGEGDVERFARPGEKPRELHSSFGTVLFSYGVVGVILFIVFFGRVLQGASLRSSVMLVPALVYTVAHQGLRFTMFWVLLTAFIVLKKLPATAKR